jgi:mannose-6-phosphate isomerase-like protein (cupin superfamily)
VIAAISVLVLFSSSASTQRGAAPTPAQPGVESAEVAARYDPTKATYLSVADVAAAIAKLPNPETRGTSIFLEHARQYRVGLDRQRVMSNAAVHEQEAEFWYIVDGSATVTTGGKLVDAKPNGDRTNWSAKALQGGTAHKVSKGDFLMIPEGVAHQVNPTPSVTIVNFEHPRPRTTYVP